VYRRDKSARNIAAMNILIARHGETAWNKEGRYQGRTDIPLSDEGERQARSLGERLKDLAIGRAVASPLSRARRTAEFALGERAPMLTLDADLVEISHGEWEGKLARDIEQSHPEMLRLWRQFPTADLPAGPGAETFAQVTDRSWRAMARAAAEVRSDQTLLIVAHDAVNRALLCKLMGLPIERVWSFQQSPATINAVAGPSIDALQLIRLNDASHYSEIFAAANHRAL
jgi:phosphoserine phosphatase